MSFKFTVFTLNITFWDVTSYNLVNMYRSLRKIDPLLIQMYEYSSTLMTTAAVGAHLPEYTAPRPENNNFHFACATQRNSRFTFFLFQLSTANVNNNAMDLSHNNVNTSPNTIRYVPSIIFLQFFLT